MGFPYRDWPLDGKTPEDYPSVCVSSHESTIGAYECRCVDLRAMTTQNVCWRSRRQGHRQRGNERTIRWYREGSASNVPQASGVDVDNRFVRSVPMNSRWPGCSRLQIRLSANASNPPCIKFQSRMLFTKANAWSCEFSYDS